MSMDEVKERFLTLASVCSFLKPNPDSRCIVEGERLLNAKHVILLGITARTESTVNIFALCLQTSAMKNCPHEVQGKLIFVNNSKTKVLQLQCSCKAGLSGSCKHSAAVLLKCTRSSISALENLSSTDLTCYWTNKKKKLQDEYEAKSLMETNCYAPRVTSIQCLSSEKEQQCFRQLVSVCKGSSLACHLRGRQLTSNMENTGIQQVPQNLELILLCASQSTFLASLDLDARNFNLKTCCHALLESINKVKLLDTALAPQRSEIWQQERQLRITGSTCYSLYNYSKENWENKANQLFWPKKFSNNYVKHGFEYEDEALDKYKNANNYNVAKCGFIICKQYSWLGYSPDGIEILNGLPVRLVEVKCPYDGIQKDAIELIDCCTYLKIGAETGITLKKNHAYYGQVQLGMAVLNLKICDLIIYLSKSKSFLNIIVHFEEVFAKDLISNISEKYFRYLLHFACEKSYNLE